MSLGCEEVRNRFSALWENELNPLEQAEVKSHLDVCSECQEEFTRFDKTLRMLHSVEEVRVPGEFLPGIYEKIEERKRKDLPSARTLWRWPHVPPRLRLPIQALAMVTTVFLALYLTKMMPGDFTKTEELGEPKSSLIGEKKEQIETKPTTAEEEKLDQLLTRKQAENMGKKDVSGSLKKEAQTEGVKGESKAIVTETPKASLEEKRVFAPPAPARTAEKSDQGLASQSALPAEPRPKEAEKPQATLSLKRKKAEDAAMIKGGVAPGPEPSQEFVLKVTDMKKALSHLQELVQQFGGETLKAEGNKLLVSLPTSSLEEFRKEVGKVSSPAKTQQKEASPKTIEGPVVASGENRSGAEKKDKETKGFEGPREGRTLIRIVLLEE